MRWLGTMLHLMYPPKPDAAIQRLAAMVDERRGHLSVMAASRRRLEHIAADPVDAVLHSIIEDL